ncbi:MAG: hypothetical protein R3E95_05385 [Thiolinea sp.]
MLRVALPVSRHDTVDANSISGSYSPDQPQFYYSWTQDELLRLEIDTVNSIMTQQPSMVAAMAAYQ